MEKVTQTTAATAEESAASSEELSAQAETSMSVVRRLEALIEGTGGRSRAEGTAPQPAARREQAHTVSPFQKSRQRPAAVRVQQASTSEHTGTLGQF